MKEINKKQTNCLIWDNGLGVEHASRLRQDGWNIRYFTFWSETGFPKFKSFVPGKGIVDKSVFFFDDIDWADVIMFPDNGIGDLADFLKRIIKKPVWGAGAGEELGFGDNSSQETRGKRRGKRGETGSGAFSRTT